MHLLGSDAPPGCHPREPRARRPPASHRRPAPPRLRSGRGRLIPAVRTRGSSSARAGPGSPASSASGGEQRFPSRQARQAAWRPPRSRARSSPAANSSGAPRSPAARPGRAQAPGCRFPRSPRPDRISAAHTSPAQPRTRSPEPAAGSGCAPRRASRWLPRHRPGGPSTREDAGAGCPRETLTAPPRRRFRRPSTRGTLGERGSGQVIGVGGPSEADHGAIGLPMSLRPSRQAGCPPKPESGGRSRRDRAFRCGPPPGCERAAGRAPPHRARSGPPACPPAAPRSALRLPLQIGQHGIDPRRHARARGPARSAAPGMVRVDRALATFPRRNPAALFSPSRAFSRSPSASPRHHDIHLRVGKVAAHVDARDVTSPTRGSRISRAMASART